MSIQIEEELLELYKYPELYTICHQLGIDYIYNHSNKEVINKNDSRNK
jgi:hypothetical protein